MNSSERFGKNIAVVKGRLEELYTDLWANPYGNLFMSNISPQFPN